MRYLAIREQPKNPKEVGRVERASRFMRICDEGRLWITAKSGGECDREVLPMRDRVTMI